MRERPILFNDDMINAVLNGTKTETRRLNRLHKINENPDDWKLCNKFIRNDELYFEFINIKTNEFISVKSPFGKFGDQLYVRETWQYYDWTEDGEPYIRYKANNKDILCLEYPEEWDDKLEDIWAELSLSENYNIDKHARDRRWRPSIFMPRWASRIQREITDIKAERLQDINYDGMKREGCLPPHICGGERSVLQKEYWIPLWNSINEKRGYGWEKNPWEFTVKFKENDQNVNRRGLYDLKKNLYNNTN